jgi:hypothetical protein
MAENLELWKASNNLPERPIVAVSGGEDPNTG